MPGGRPYAHRRISAINDKWSASGGMGANSSPTPRGRFRVGIASAAVAGYADAANGAGRDERGTHGSFSEAGEAEGRRPEFAVS